MPPEKLCRSLHNPAPNRVRGDCGTFSPSCENIELPHRVPDFVTGFSFIFIVDISCVERYLPSKIRDKIKLTKLLGFTTISTLVAEIDVRIF